MLLLSNLRAKEWRLETLEDSLSLTPYSIDVLFDNRNLPSLTEIKELFLKGTKANDNKIRNMGIVISHDAIVYRRKHKEES